MRTSKLSPRLPINEWYDSIIDIPIQFIKPDPENLRTEFDEDDLIDLGKNIEQVGQLDAITVFPLLTDDGEWSGLFDLHDGERRWRAAQLVEIPALTSKIVPQALAARVNVQEGQQGNADSFLEPRNQAVRSGEGIHGSGSGRQAGGVAVT